MRKQNKSSGKRSFLLSGGKHSRVHSTFQVVESVDISDQKEPYERRGTTRQDRKSEGPRNELSEKIREGRTEDKQVSSLS